MGNFISGAIFPMFQVFSRAEKTAQGSTHPAYSSHVTFSEILEGQDFQWGSNFRLPPYFSCGCRGRFGHGFFLSSY